MSYGCAPCSCEGEWSPGSSEQPEGVKLAHSLLPTSRWACGVKPRQQESRAGGVMECSRVRDKNWCWPGSCSGAASLTPLLWSHPGLWHQCLSDPLEPCVSFSLVGWDINVPVPQSGGKKRHFEKFLIDYLAASQSRLGLGLSSDLPVMFTFYSTRIINPAKCARENETKKIPPLSISVSTCAFLWSWECSSSTEEGMNDEISLLSSP